MTLDSVGSDARANEIALKLKIRKGAHGLKEECNIKNNEMSEYDIKYEKRTRLIYLERKDKRGKPIETGYTLPDGY